VLSKCYRSVIEVLSKRYLECVEHQMLLKHGVMVVHDDLRLVYIRELA
jgi:hypothetical protein